MAERVTDIPIPQRVLIIGDDMSSVPLVRRYLQELGTPQVEQIEDGGAAWQQMQKTAYDFLVLNWKLLGLSSIALFNRIRHSANHAMTPIVVGSNNVQSDAFRLLDEFPCSRLVELPTTGPAFGKAAMAAFEEAEWYRRRRPFTERIFSQAYHDPERIRKSVKQLLKDAHNPVPASLMIAEILLSQGQLDQAEAIYRKVRSYSRDSIPALNGIGKVLYRRGKPEEAFTFLCVAWRQCEMNIERLCLLGEIEIGQHDAKSAEGCFQQALVGDQENVKASAGLMICRNLDEYLRRHTPVGLPRSFASVCNSVGIALIRNEQRDRGMEQYHAALKFLGDDPAASLVMFNMGLGYARWQKWEEAYRWFEKSAQLAPPDFKKAGQWLNRLSAVAGKAAAGDSVRTVEFEADDDIIVESSGEDQEIVEIHGEDSWFEDIYDE